MVGAANGLLVTRTGLPSFIVTLASYFVLRGLESRHYAPADRADADPLHHQGTSEVTFVSLFAGKFGQGLFTWLGEMGVIPLRADGLPVIRGLSMSIAWWLALTALATWILGAHPVRQLDLCRRRR